MQAEALTSTKNPLLKAIRRATTRGALTGEGFCIAEGVHLLEEAVRSGCEIYTVLFAEFARETVGRLAPQLGGAPLYALANPVFREIATTEATQGVIALVRPPAWTLERTLDGDGVAVALDGVQEPGNAGAIIRTAEAFGATGVVFLKGTVSPYNPKTLRASAGSLFRMPYVHDVDDASFLAALERNGRCLFSAMPDAGTLVHDADLKQRCAILIGSEGRGVRPELARQAEALRIPTRGVQSLNAAIAAGVVLYEAQRQRTVR